MQKTESNLRTSRLVKVQKNTNTHKHYHPTLAQNYFLHNVPTKLIHYITQYYCSYLGLRL